MSMLQGIKKDVCWREAWGRRGGCIVSLLSWESAVKENRREMMAEKKKGSQERNRTRSGYSTGMLWWCTRSWLAQSNYTFDVKAITSLAGCI